MPKTEPFDKHSDAYDEWFKKNIVLYEAELEAIRQLIPPPGAEGMEVGVGSGKFAAPLGIKIGVEPSEKMAIKAKMLGINVYPGVAEELPFSDGRFDYLLMVTTICFVDDVIKSFKEAFRVLKLSGCIIVGFVDKESELGRKYADKKEESKFYKDAAFFSTQEVL
ncbi:MAG: class I SAM-dependent methyltransferase, partial [Deltaproteobacteria bacterium]|nr:class I SAM-dependent methyltransferase [Deltaproteobacteria bacterium]